MMSLLTVSVEIIMNLMFFWHLTRSHWTTTSNTDTWKGSHRSPDCGVENLATSSLQGGRRGTDTVSGRSNDCPNREGHLRGKGNPFTSNWSQRPLRRIPFPIFSSYQGKATEDAFFPQGIREIRTICKTNRRLSRWNSRKSQKVIVSFSGRPFFTCLKIFHSSLTHSSLTIVVDFRDPDWNWSSRRDCSGSPVTFLTLNCLP